MTRFRETAEGPVPFTLEEEAEWDAMEAEYNSQEIFRIQAKIIEDTQERLDKFAQTRNYDGILSLCTYANSPTAKFASEGQYGVVLRDSTWAKLYEIYEQVNQGTRPPPLRFSDIESELPPMTWPE